MTLKIGCSPITGRIHIGTVQTDKRGIQLWCKNKTEVTDDAINAVLWHLKYRVEKGEDPVIIEGSYPNGKTFKLTYTEKVE